MVAIDSSDRAPDGGYIAPLFPPTYARDATHLLEYAAPFDAALDDLRARATAIYRAHALAYAGGGDLDRLAARYGVYRYPYEDDEALRARIPAMTAGRVNPTSRAGLAATLAAMTRRGVSVTNQAAPGRVLVTFDGLPPQGLGIVPLIAALKAASYQFDAIARAGVAGGRVGGFRVGAQRLGGGGYVTLTPRAPATAPTGHARVGGFRVGAQRLGI